MKKSAAVVLTLVMMITLVLSACGKKNSDGEQGASPSASASGTGAASPTASGSASPSDSAAPSGDMKFGLVTDVGGINDKSFNQSAWEGLQKVASEVGAQPKALESKEDANYLPNLNQFVGEGYNLTWGIGFLMGDAVKQAADENPDAKLAIIDNVVDAPNVESVTFAEHEGSFLVGVVAGLMTKSNKIGFVGGMEIPVIKRFEAGFKAGVAAVNPKAKVTINYTGAFDKPDLGKAAAATIYNDGADIIFHASGGTGDGVFNEAKERNSKGKKVWVIGVDKDQSLSFGDDVTLTSMLKRVDQAVYQVTKDLVGGNFKGGQDNVRVLGLKEDGVGLPETSSKNVPADVLAKVEEYKQKIISGEIKVPAE